MHDCKSTLHFRVLDYSDLNLSATSRPVELYLLVSMQVNGNRLETKKLRVSCKKTAGRYSEKAASSSSSSNSDESAVLSAATLTLDLDAAFAAASVSSSRDDSAPPQRPQLRLSLWHDLLGGFNSYFHGELRILLDERTLRPRTERQGPQWYV